MVGRPSVFLSSCFEDPVGSKLEIRRRIYEMTGGSAAAGSRPVWMAEDFPELRPDFGLTPFGMAEFCVEGVRATESFVAIITGRHGSEIQVTPGQAVPTSFLEIELFEAALLRKPAFVFVLEGTELSKKADHLLQILRPCFPGIELGPLSADEIVRRVDRLVSYYEKPKWRRHFVAAPRIDLMVDTLLRLRHSAYRVADELPRLRFLEGLSDDALGPPDDTLVQAVLDRAEAAANHQERLTLLWMAIRALMGAPFGDSRHRHYLPLWEIALGRWASAGAWYGLHGHAAMGCLAALGSLGAVRAAMGDAIARIPHGEFASAYYSIAGLARRPQPILELALAHIEAALEKDGDPANRLAIRASVLTRLGDISGGLRDYEEVAARREAIRGAPDGEALSELGFAQFRAGEWRRGIANMEEGLSQLRKEPVSGFTVRATRKLAYGYVRKWRLNRALDLGAEAFGMAERIGAVDQVDTFQRFAHRIDRMRFWRN